MATTQLESRTGYWHTRVALTGTVEGTSFSLLNGVIELPANGKFMLYYQVAATNYTNQEKIVETRVESSTDNWTTVNIEIISYETAATYYTTTGILPKKYRIYAKASDSGSYPLLGDNRANWLGAVKL